MLFQTKNHVPDIFTKTSRDFQLLGSVIDALYNYGISNQLKINYIDDLEIVDAKLLSLISKYLGFFTDMYYPEDLLRAILMNFPDMIRNKGSFKGIQTAVKALQNAYTDISFVDITPTDEESHYIISTDGVIIDQNYIDEVLAYVLPIGTIIDQIQIIQDINNLKPEIYKNIDNIVGLFFDSSYDSSDPDYIIEQGALYSGLIRNSDPIELGNHNKNTYFSKVGQTPIVKSAIRGIINPKSI